VIVVIEECGAASDCFDDIGLAIGIAADDGRQESGGARDIREMSVEWTARGLTARGRRDVASGYSLRANPVGHEKGGERASSPDGALKSNIDRGCGDCDAVSRDILPQKRIH